MSGCPFEASVRISAISKRNYLIALKSSCRPYWSVLAQLTEKLTGTTVRAKFLQIGIDSHTPDTTNTSLLLYTRGVLLMPPRLLASGIASCATFLFSPHFDVIYDQLLNRRTATWNLFVNLTMQSIRAKQVETATNSTENATGAMAFTRTPSCLYTVMRRPDGQVEGRATRLSHKLSHILPKVVQNKRQKAEMKIEG